MFCGLLLGNSFVRIGTSSPSPGARLDRGLMNSSLLQSVSRHAEMDSLAYLRNHNICKGKKKARLVIIRYTSDGSYGNSRPCIHCILRIARYYGDTIKNVTFYEDGLWYCQRPDECANSSRLSSADKRQKGLLHRVL
mmetsp:Transcript_19573/g.28602  ORF Transcript_19573/g.28602 Transcript_19573/m.28602 type:complete len:137 (+) Transcript_19573:209-619(+)